MPAKVLLVSGSQPGEEHWIEDDVVRIGSDASCDVHLHEPDVPAHAATVEFSDGTYNIYNRSNAPMRVDRQLLKPGARGRWPAGKELAITDRLTVRLIVEGDPRPAKRIILPAAVPLPEPEEEALEAPVAPVARKSSNAVLLIVVMICFVAAVAFAVLRNSSKETASDTWDPSDRFMDLVSELTRAMNSAESPTAKDEVKTLLMELQDARMAELRGDKKGARTQYDRLHDNFRDALQGEAQPTENADKLNSKLNIPNKLVLGLRSFTEKQLTELAKSDDTAGP